MEIALEELRRLRWELLVCNLLLLGGLLLLGRDLVPVLLGMALGNSAAAANFCADRHSSGRSGSASSRSGPPENGFQLFFPDAYAGSGAGIRSDNFLV